MNEVDTVSRSTKIRVAQVNLNKNAFNVQDQRHRCTEGNFRSCYTMEKFAEVQVNRPRQGLFYSSLQLIVSKSFWNCFSSIRNVWNEAHENLINLKRRNVSGELHGLVCPTDFVREMGVANKHEQHGCIEVKLLNGDRNVVLARMWLRGNSLEHSDQTEHLMAPDTERLLSSSRLRDKSFMRPTSTLGK